MFFEVWRKDKHCHLKGKWNSITDQLSSWWSRVECFVNFLANDRSGLLNSKPRNRGHLRFVIDIGVGWEAKEMRLAVQNGFTVFAFEMLPGNIQELKQLVQGDSRFQFVELQEGRGSMGTTRAAQTHWQHRPCLRYQCCCLGRGDHSDVSRESHALSRGVGDHWA